MTLAAGFTLAVIVIALLLMASNKASPDLVLLGGVIVLAVAGVLTPAQALSGFGNPGMLTVAALFIVAAGLRETGAVSMFTSRLLGRPSTERGALTRLVLPVMGASAFLNNTTIVATMLPAVHDWSRRIGIAPARLLMPLSFASIVGGTCTLIGTSTNLVVAGMVQERLGTHPGLHEIGMFELTPVGLPIAAAGALVLILLGPKLLPDRTPALSTADDPRKYAMEVIVPAGSRLDGQTIEDAGLRHLPGAFLMEIVRDGRVQMAVGHDRRLQVGDRLVFVGDVQAVVDLQRTPGLAAAPDQVFKLEGDRQERRIVEAVVSARNPILGQSIRDAGFRKRYNSVVIAVARAGERVAGRIGDIILQVGDVLLLEAHPDFQAQQRTRSEFYLVSSVDGANPPRFERAWLAMVILAGLVASVSLGLLPTAIAAFLAAGLMILGRCCTLDEARRGPDLQVLVAIAAAFGLGHAMQVTGLDQIIAQLAVQAGSGSPFAALVVLYVVTTVMTETVTNNAAAVLAVPLGLSMAAQLGANPMPYVLVVMISASASYLSPIGYQTNLMVFGPGGYRFSDYTRLGLPMSLATGVVALTVIPWLWPL